MKSLMLASGLACLLLAACTNVTPHDASVSSPVPLAPGYFKYYSHSGVGSEGGAQMTESDTFACRNVDRYGRPMNCQRIDNRASGGTGVEQAVDTAFAAAIPQAVGIAASGIGGSALLRPSTSSITLDNGNQISNSTASSAAANAAARARAFGQGGTGGSVGPINNINNKLNRNGTVNCNSFYVSC